MTVPVIMFENVFLGEVDIAHAVGRHVHTQPDAENTLHVIKILLVKVTLLLRGNHAADIENRSVKKLVLLW